MRRKGSVTGVSQKILDLKKLSAAVKSKYAYDPKKRMAKFAATRLAYEGDYARSGKRHGQGKYQFDDGSVYEGTWRNDNQHGRGIHTFVNGERYEGSYVKGLMHGNGTWHNTDGSSYTGTWENGFKSMPLFIDGKLTPCCHADWSSDQNGFSDRLLVRTVPALADGALKNADEVAGNIAVIQRGNVAFTEKVQRALEAGAVGVLIVNNNQAEKLFDMADPSHQSPAGGFAIPALAVSYATGVTMVEGATCTILKKSTAEAEKKESVASITLCMDEHLDKDKAPAAMHGTCLRRHTAS